MFQHLTPFGILSFINFITCVFIGTFLWLKNKKSAVGISYCIFNYCISFYSFFYFLWQSASGQDWGTFFFKWTIVGVVLMNSAFVHFTFVVLHLHLKHRRALLAIHAINAFFCYGALSLFYDHWKIKYAYGLWPVPSKFFFVYLVWWSLQVLYCFYLIHSLGVARTEGKRRKQFQWIFWATLIAYAGGATNWLVWYDVNFPPYLNSGIAIYTLVLSYAIFRHQVLGMDVIIKKTLVFAGLVAFVFGVFSLGLFVAQELLTGYLGLQRQLALGISIFIIVLGYEPMRSFLIEVTDKFLFQKKYDYQKMLKDASRGMSQIESLHHLLGIVVHFITLRIRIKNAAVLMWDLKAHRFHLAFLRGYPKGYSFNRELGPESHLISYLRNEKGALDQTRVDQYLEGDLPQPKKDGENIHYDYLTLKSEMKELRAACCVPSFLGNELRSVLILGEKKSGDYFSKEDLNILFTLAQESAIAIENARLFDEALSRSRELEMINKEMEAARTRLAHALEDTERANRELQNTQAQLIHEQKMATLGRLAASVGHEVNNPLTILSMNVSRVLLKFRKEPDLKVAEILDLFQKMEQNIGRIKAVVNTLTGLLKKSEKGKFEPLSLKLILEETLPLVQFQTYLDNPTGTEVEFDIPASVPLIRGDLERLQEVFLNLFINAYHAMTGRRNRKIAVQARLSAQDPKMVEVDFTDNGSGMSEEVQKRIFTYGFTTKGPGRGSGMGLYICRYIVELHGGEMKVRSQPGIGTTFSLTLPAYEEAHTAGLSSAGIFAK